jgi:hypothetical protein
MPNQKSEIRISKSETNSNVPMSKSNLSVRSKNSLTAWGKSGSAYRARYHLKMLTKESRF